MFVSRSTLVIGALVVVIGTCAESFGAQREGRRLIRLLNTQPESLPTPEAAPVPPSAEVPSQKYVGPVQQPKYCVSYKHHCTLRRTCCHRCVRQKIVLDVQDPCCQSVSVPVSIPGCCQGDPYVSTGRDILKRFSYTYQWASGYKVDVVFRPRGDIVVHTWGR